MSTSWVDEVPFPLPASSPHFNTTPCGNHQILLEEAKGSSGMFWKSPYAESRSTVLGLPLCHGQLSQTMLRLFPYARRLVPYTCQLTFRGVRNVVWSVFCPGGGPGSVLPLRQKVGRHRASHLSAHSEKSNTGAWIQQHPTPYPCSKASQHKRKREFSRFLFLSWVVSSPRLAWTAGQKVCPAERKLGAVRRASPPESTC